MNTDQLLALLAGFAFGVLASGGLISAWAVLARDALDIEAVPSSDRPVQQTIYRGGRP